MNTLRMHNFRHPPSLLEDGFFFCPLLLHFLHSFIFLLFMFIPQSLTAAIQAAAEAGSHRLEEEEEAAGGRGLWKKG